MSPRTTTSGEDTDLASLDRQELRKVEIENASTTLIDYTSVSGVDYVDDVRVDVSADTPIMTASVRLFREVDGTSWAPLMNSPEPIKEGRQLNISAAVIGQGDTVTSGDWQVLFDGTIDDVSWGGSGAVLDLQARGPGGLIKDTLIESETAYGNDSSPVNIETVIQSLLNDNLASPPTLSTVGSPSFGIVEYTQRRQSLWDAIQTLAELIGWDLRYVWDDGTSAFVLTFQEPDRSKTSVDHTFSADDYFDVSEFTRGTGGVRNRCIVEWEKGSTVTADDTASINEFRKRVIYLDSTADPQIRDATKAQALASAVIGDTGQPIARQQIEGAFYWPVQLGDLYRWTANDVHYSSDQDMAVTAFSHMLPRDPTAPFTTTFLVRGQPTGSVSRWHRKERKRERRDDDTDIGVPPDPYASFVPEVDGSDELTGTLTGNESVKSVKILASKVDVPAAGDVRAETAIDGTVINPATLGSINDDATASAMSVLKGDLIYISWFAYTEASGAGKESRQFSMRWQYADANNDADITSVVVGFDDAGHPLITAMGDEDTANIYITVGRGSAPASPTAGANDGSISGRVGTVELNGAGDEVEVGELVYAKARGANSEAVLGSTFTTRRRRGDAQYVPPRIDVIATRSSDSVKVDITIEDPSYAVSANPSHKRRDGDDQTWDGSWRTSWSSSSGTAGTDATLTRSITLSDPYTALSWRVQWLDELGNAKVIGDDIDFASVQQLTKTLTFSSGRLVPESESTKWLRDRDVTEGLVLYVNDSSTTQQTYYCGVEFPPKVILTDIRWRAGVADQATDDLQVQLRRDGTAIASAVATGTGFQTLSDTMNQTVAASHNYSMQVDMFADSTTGAAIGRTEIDYDAPSYKQSY